MFEFMTVRELYEICRADNAVETDNVEYVELFTTSRMPGTERT